MAYTDPINMMRKEKEPVKQKLWNRDFILLFVISIFLNSASQMTTSYITSLALELGAEFSLATTIASLMSWAALFIRPFSGRCSDRYNRRTLVIISNTATIICMLLILPVRTPGALAAVRILHGVAFSFSGVSIMAFNSMYIPDERMGEGMGWISLSSILSQALGPNIGSFLTDLYGIRACFIAASVMTLTGIIIILFIKCDSPETSERKKFDINDYISFRILPYALILCLFSAGNGLVTSMLQQYGIYRAIGSITLFYTAYSLSMLAVRPFAGKLADTKGLKGLLIPSLIIGSAAFIVLGTAKSLIPVIIAGCLKALGQGTGSPAIQSSSITMLGKDRAGVVSSTCYIGQDIGNALAPVLGGYMVSMWGYETMFIGYSILLTIAGTAIYLIKARYDYKQYGQIY